MAIITSVRSVMGGQSGSASLDVPIGPNDDGDLIVIAWQRYAANTTQPTATGFSGATSANYGVMASGFIYKVNSGGTTPSTVNITWGATIYANAQSYVIKGAAASPIGANGSNGDTTKYLTAATVTTTAANSLVLHSVAHRSFYPMVPTLGTFTALGAGNSNASGENSGTSGAEFVASVGASSTFYFGDAVSAASLDCALEIKSATGSIPIGVSGGREVIEYNGGFSTLPTWSAPNNATIGITSIAGVSMGTSAPSLEYDVATGEFFRTTRTYTVNYANVWLGGFETVSADLTDKILAVPWARSRNSLAFIGDKGVICVLVDGSYNWVAYTLRSVADGFDANKRYVGFIKYGVTTALDSGGPSTFDISNIDYIGIFVHGPSSTAGDSYIYLGTLWAEASPTVFTGGSAEAPLCVDYITRHLLGAGSWPQIASLQGTKQALLSSSVQIGNGTTATYFKSTGQSLAFRTPDFDWKLGDGDVGLTLKGSSSCVLDLSSSIIVGESLQNFTIDSASSTSATYNLTGASFINLNWASDISLDYSSASFSQCNLVELGGGDVSNLTANNPKGTAVATVSVSGGSITNSSFDVTRTGTDASYHLELGTAVTAITLASVTFSGTPATDKIHVKYPETVKASTALVTGRRYKIKTAGTTTWTSVGAADNNVGTEFTATGTAAGTGDAYEGVIITTSGTTSIVSGDITKDAANTPVQIAAPALYQEVVISGFEPGSRIQIYDTTSSTELFNGTASSGNTVVSGSTATWTDNVAATASRAIRVRIAYVGDDETVDSGLDVDATADPYAFEFIEANIGTCGITSGTESISYLANQVPDSVYINNGIDGSAVTGVTFTDAATDVININVAANTISWKSIYAAWVYYAFTATGIATDIDYIDGVDEANYILSSMKVKNTSSPTAPLSITGGYGRDSVTGLAVTLVDTTGGTIVMAPDHVVSYAVGSGVTPGDIIDITTGVWNAAARTLTTTIPSTTDIWSDSKALTVGKFLGLK